MAKKKKIGIKFFLNKRLNPEVIDGETYYRIYVRASYNRINTQFYFPLVYQSGFATEEEFEQFFERRKDTGLNEHIAYCQSLIEAVIRFEARIIGDDYKITGLASRFYLYEDDLLTEEIGKHLKRRLRKHLQEAIHANQLDKAFHDAMLLEDSFYLITDNIKPNLKKSLPNILSSEIAAYIHLKAFCAYEDWRALTFLDWIRGPRQIDFKQFLYARIDASQIFRNELPSSPAIRLYEDFPVRPLQIPTCLQSIDNMIISIAM